MMSSKFLIILAISFAVYFVLDFVLRGAMFFIMSGSILGSLYELSGKRIGMLLSTLIWIILLVGIVILFFHTQNKPLQFFLILLIGALLYVVDVVIGQIGEPFMSDSEEIKRIAMVGKMLKWAGILIKSVILSWIIYTGINKS
jgi:predicted membrane channel-forming protein YqfA (hemolysin III family)